MKFALLQGNYRFKGKFKAKSQCTLDEFEQDARCLLSHGVVFEQNARLLSHVVVIKRT